MSITKKNISKEISNEINLSSKESIRFIDRFLSMIKFNINKHDIKINKFGTFYLKDTPQRLGRNPKTREEYIISKSKKAVFRPSSNIKDYIN
jgi:integration host factor subunit alpha